MQTELDPQSKHCPICSSSKLMKFKAHAFDTEEPTFVHITECKECCFAWQYPLGRTEQESAEHFEFNYKDKGNRVSDYFDPKKKRKISSLEFGFLSQLPVAERSLLDIGAGAGIFAEVAAENGWLVTAIDPALDVERLVGSRNITAIRGTTETLSDHELFDVITMWDVIEHVTNPVETLSNASAHLKDGGWLVIETGNYKSADRLAGGKRHWMYQLDHRWYFSPESMTHILLQLGFSEIVHSQKALRPGWAGSADYDGPSRAYLLKSVAKDPLNAPLHISTFCELRKARSWAAAGIGIFALAGQKQF